MTVNSQPQPTRSGSRLDTAGAALYRARPVHPRAAVARGAVLTMLLSLALLPITGTAQQAEGPPPRGEASDRVLPLDGPAAELLAVLDMPSPPVRETLEPLRQLLAPEVRGPRAERILARNHERLRDYLLRVDAEPREFAVVLAEYPHEQLHLRPYPSSETVRLPHAVLSDRGGHAAELALASALLYESLGLEVQWLRFAEEAGEEASPPRWALRIRASRERLERVLVEQADNEAARLDGRVLLERLTALAAPVFVLFTDPAEDGKPPGLEDPERYRESGLAAVLRHILARRLAVLRRALRQEEPETATVEQAVAVQQMLAELEPKVEHWVALIELLELWLSRLSESEPRTEQVKAAIGVAERHAIEAGGGEQPGLIYRAARRALERGERDEARQHLEKLVQQHPAFHPPGRRHPLVLLAEVAHQAGEKSDALAYFREAHERGLGSAADRATGAALAYRLGEEYAEVALELYDAAERRGYAELEMYLRRGKLYLERLASTGTGPAEARLARLHAEANFRAARALDSGSRDAHLWLIKSLMSVSPNTAPATVEPPPRKPVLEAIAAAQQRFPEWSFVHKLEAYVYRDWYHEPQKAYATLRRYVEEMEPDDEQASADLARLRAAHE